MKMGQSKLEKRLLFGFPNKALEKSYKMEYNLYYKMICYHGLVRFSERKAVFT